MEEEILFEDLDTEVQAPEAEALSVSQISQMIAGTLQRDFDNVTVKGEVSGLKKAASGHIYFSIKDDGAVLNAICWRAVASSLTMKLEDGLEVIIRGSIASYPTRSNYQIIAQEIRTSGLGALMALLEKRKKQLAAEGLFDAARKKPIPYMPKVIGIVTSPTGAVIRDILHRLNDRWGCQVYVYSCLVQGDCAAEQIAEGIKYFNELKPATKSNKNNVQRPDVIIVARGGGSIEDLWAFNEEAVVRAAAASDIPLISAVGHETDTTLIDYASDRRAPTPTAAAEMATPVKEELVGLMMDIEKRLFSGVNRVMLERRNFVAGLTRGLISPARMLDNMVQKLDDRSERLRNSISQLLESKLNGLHRYSLKDHMLKNMLENAAKQLQNIVSLMQSYDHRNVLKRGFALLRGPDGHIVKSMAQLTMGDVVNIELADGGRSAEILGNDDATPKKPVVKSKPVKAQNKERAVEPKKQETLF